MKNTAQFAGFLTNNGEVGTKTPIQFMEKNFGLTLKIPVDKWNEIDTVIEWEVK